jgi:hypothetical protein
LLRAPVPDLATHVVIFKNKQLVTNKYNCCKKFYPAYFRAQQKESK